jgi:hypothetical protein
VLVSDADVRVRLGDISVMTARRWRVDPRVGWPKTAAIIRGRRYYHARDVEAFLDLLIQKTATGASTTSAPIPHRRSRKKPSPELAEAPVP